MFGCIGIRESGGRDLEIRAAAEKRCMDLVKRLYGTENVARYDQLRLVDPAVVDQIAAEVDKLARATRSTGPTRIPWGASSARWPRPSGRTTRPTRPPTR